MPYGSRRVPLAFPIVEHKHIASRKVTCFTITNGQRDMTRLDSDKLCNFIGFEIVVVTGFNAAHLPVQEVLIPGRDAPHRIAALDEIRLTEIGVAVVVDVNIRNKHSKPLCKNQIRG